MDNEVEALVVDPATTVFWRNVYARKLEAGKPFKSGDPDTAKIVTWDLPADVPLGAAHPISLPCCVVYMNAA